MADYIDINSAQTLTKHRVKTEEISGEHHQRAKIGLGAVGVDDGPVCDSNPMPIKGAPQTASNISGTIATGGAAQSLVGVNGCKNGFFLINNSGASLWVNDLGTATMTNTSIEIKAGDYFQMPYGTANAISIIGSLTGQSFTGRAW